ncbi:MAG: ABC transporter substrate-binding protein [Sphingobacteriaceae bacterium]|nr:ABC transporter substrate-binding protein [Sphingobacteriaceae bacterium]
MSSFIDQTGKEIIIHAKPRRIVSLVPSQSEFLWEIGLQGELVGITKFCIHPAEMFNGVTRVGGTKKLDIEKIKSLNPDLIIGNKEENEKEQIEELQKHFKVWMSDIYTIHDAFNMMHEIGRICERKKEVNELLIQITKGIDEINDLFMNKKVAYFIWKDPYMCCGGNTFIGNVLETCGLKNIINPRERYPVVDEKEIIKEVDYCFLSTEPYPFKDTDVQQLQMQSKKPR